MDSSSPASQWIQLEIPGLFEQLENSSDSNLKIKVTRRQNGATQTKSAAGALVRTD